MKNQNNFKKALLLFLTAGTIASIIFSIFCMDIWVANVANEPVGKEPENKEGVNERDEEFYKTIGNEHRFLSQKERDKAWNDVLSRSSENEFGDMPVSSWTCIGPYGIRKSSGFELYSGRVLDIQVEGAPSTRVGAASGGLWGFAGLFPVPLSDSLTSLVIGAFDTHHQDPNIIIVGTGEWNGSAGGGTGLWKTTDGGITWVQKTITPQPYAFYRIRYAPGINSVIHAASTEGYFRSDDGGETWNLKTAGNVTDMAINPNGLTIYIAKYGNSIYKSTNGGNSFLRVLSFPVADTDFGRAAVSLCTNGPEFVYVTVSKPDGRDKGIYRTTDDGLTWQDISFAGSFYWGQGNYDNCIAVSPNNRDLVLVGGGALIRTSDGGASWQYYQEGDPGVENLHNDHHVIRWHSDGIRVWLGNDGGMAFSDDAGLTWSVISNFLPITQFYDFDIGVSGSNIIVAGGTQDNAVPSSLNCTVTSAGTWNWGAVRDAGGTKIDRSDPYRMISNTFNMAGNWIERTTDGGATWVESMSGLSSTIAISNIEDDGGSMPYCYIGHGNKIYNSTDFGASWQQYTSQTFPSTVWTLGVSKFGAGGNIIYAGIFTNPPLQSNILRVYDSGVWYDRGATLPLVPLKHIAQHPADNNIAYAITKDYWSTQKVLKTTNRGINWTNITGDLPNIPAEDLVQHPTNNNVLFLGTKGFGMWKTTNGGMNWFRWNNGMPQANQIVRLKVIDSTAVSGRFYVVAASHGRGIWIREASGDEPITITVIINKVDTLKNRVDTLVSSGNLPRPFGIVLNNHLRGAVTQLNQGHLTVAINKMQSFNSEVTQLIQHQFLLEQLGLPLIANGNEIISLIQGLNGNANNPRQLTESKSFSLEQNFPNPFNPVTHIKFEIPLNSRVTLKIYDIMGREVASPVEGNLNAGVHEVEWNGSSLSSGVYFYKLSAENSGARFEKTMKMILVK